MLALTLRSWLPIALSCLAAACGGGGRTSKEPALHEIILDAPYPERPMLDPFGESAMSAGELLEHLQEVAESETAKGVLLQVGGLEGRWATAHDLGVAIEAVRAAGKPVHCHFQMTDNLGYALMASHCDRISMTPAGMLNLVGVAAEVVYARELLDKVGLKAELLQVGRFKGAADALTLDGMPPETKQTLDAVLDQFHGRMRTALVRGRKLDETKVKATLDAGPYAALRARSAGLVDDVGYDDEARAHAKAAAKVERVVRISRQPERESPGIGDLIGALLDKPPRGPGGRERVALAHLQGTIMSGSPGGGSGGGRSASASSFVAAMRDFADDEDVKAVVLRIDSPGGSATASDRMWHAVRRVAKRKPVLVSIGEMAASGGYYVASAGHTIYARDDSLVGSIGVVGGKIAVADVAARSGVHVQALKRGDNAGWASPMRTFSEQERTAVRSLLTSTYHLFLRRVAQGRGVEESAVVPLAAGRLLTGRAAREGGLVDLEGGLQDVLAAARKEASLDDEAPIQVWPPRQSMMERFGQALSGGGAAQSALLGLLGGGPGHASSLLQALLALPDGPMVVLPYGLRIK